MADVTRGGLTVKVLQGRSTRLLLEYRTGIKEADGLEKEGYLFAASRNCSLDVMTQIAEFEATQDLHGTRGQRTTPKAKYIHVDETGLDADGRPATHVVGARGRKRLACAGETATHVRIEPDLDIGARHDMVHTIYAAGADLVNPDDPEAMKSFFDMVVDERETRYPGLQESIWLERNGKSGLAHVHVASNATIYAGFELREREFQAGQKMAGGLTHVHSLRDDINRFMDANPRYGFAQALPTVGTKEYWTAQSRSGQKDYWDQARAAQTSTPVTLGRHEQLRQEIWSALASDAVKDEQGFSDELARTGIESKITGVRRGKETASADFSYRPQGAKAWTRGKTLGEEYTLSAVREQLKRKQAGQEIAPRADAVSQRGTAPAPLPFEQKPLSPSEARELERLRGSIEELANAAREAQQTPQQQAPPHGYDDLFDAHAQTITAERVAALEQGRSTSSHHAEISDMYQQAMAADRTPTPELDAALHTADLPFHEPEIEAAPEPAPYRSALRSVSSSNERTMRRVAALAELEEEYEQRAFVVDAGFVERLKDANGVAGVSAGTLSNLGEQLHPEMRNALTRYVDKTAAAREQWQAHKDLGDELRGMYSHKHPLGHASDLRRRRVLQARHLAHEETLQQLRDEINVGDLSLDREQIAKAPQEAMRHHMEAESTMLGERDRSLASMKLPGYLQQERPREAELVALVAGEDSKGHVLVDVQLRAEDPLAKNQRGLHLWASRVGEAQTQMSHAAYSREDVDRMIAAAGDKKVIVAGQRAFAFRGTVKPGVTRTGGRQLRVQAGSVKRAELPTPGRDFLAVQTAHEDRVRATTPNAAQKQHAKAEAARERVRERSREQGGYDRSM